MKQIFLIFFCVLFFSDFLTGCVGLKTKNEESPMAAKNTINYIEKKYGFSPKITSIKYETSSTGPFSIKNTGYAFVNCEYNSKKFQVYIINEYESDDGLDDYQKDEITNDLMNYISSKTNLKPYNYKLFYSKYRTYTYNGFISELYTKDNLFEIINNNSFRLLIEYINEDNLKFLKEGNVLKEFKNSEILLINYYSKKAYNNSNHDYDLINWDIVIDLPYNALNIESAYSFYHGYDDYYDFDVKSIDDIYYYVYSISSYSDNSYDSKIIPYLYNNYTLTKTSEKIDISNFVGGCKKSKQVSETYKFNNVVNIKSFNYCIYMPQIKLKKYKVENIELGQECGDSFFTDYVKKVGNMLVVCPTSMTRSNSNSLKFMFFNEKC